MIEDKGSLAVGGLSVDSSHMDSLTCRVFLLDSDSLDIANLHESSEHLAVCPSSVAVSNPSLLEYYV